MRGAKDRDKQQDGTNQYSVPANIVTNEHSLSENSALSTSQDEYILQIPEVKRRLTDELNKYVTTVVFKRNKFHMTSEAEEKYCRHAVAIGQVKLPQGVTSQKFGKMFSKVLRSRMNALRGNAQTNAKLKFKGESSCSMLVTYMCG